MIICATNGCSGVSLTDAGGLCARCNRRPVKVKGERLCGACYMAKLRQADRLEREKHVTLRLDPWLRLEQASIRLTRARDLGWSSRAVLSAEEQLKRAAEGFRRSRRNPHTGRHLTPAEED